MKKQFKIWGFCVLFISFAGSSAEAWVSARFRGPDSTHVQYSFYNQFEYEYEVLISHSGGTDYIASGKASGQISGQYHHTGLSPGTYTYSVRRKEAGEWVTKGSSVVEIDGESASGVMMYDESYTSGLTISNITVSTGRSLELGGHIEGLGVITVEAGADISIQENTEFSSQTTVVFESQVTLNNIKFGLISFSGSSSGSTLSDLTFSGVTVYNNITLNLEGSFYGPPDPENTNDRLDVSMAVYGAVSFGSGVTMGNEVRVYLYTAHQISDLTGGHIVLNADGCSVSNCSGTIIDPRKGGTLSDLENCTVVLNGAHWIWNSGLEDGKEVSIRDSTISSMGSAAATGKYVLDHVVWAGSVFFGGNSETVAVETDFLAHVDIGKKDTYGSSDPQPETKFTSQGSRFSSLRTQRVRSGNVQFNNSMFSGAVTIYGGAPSFSGCEFGSTVTMLNRNAATIQSSLFVDQLRFFNLLASDFRDYSDAPRWHEQSSPSPTISNNAFMGRIALSYERRYGEGNDLPSSKIDIGSNYYGDKNGYLMDQSAGFLGITGGHFGAQLYAGLPGVGGSQATNVFNMAEALPSSPVSGSRQDRSVFPKFWVNGHVVGQNTLHHQISRLSTSNPNLMQGRATLLSVNVMTTEASLSGVRVYADWNGQKVYAQPRGPMRRDISSFSANQITFGAGTFDIILPGVNEAGMSVSVSLETSGINGFDDDANPGDIYLLSGTIGFSPPPQRPLRIHVIPIQLRGLFGGVLAAASSGKVVQTLRTELPEMFNLPPDKIQVTTSQRISYWSPTSAITTVGTMNGISAALAMGRGISGWIHDDPPDFIVAVMPSGWIVGGSDGANMALRRNILFVDEDKPSAVFHEMGHGIGLNNGWGQEQYDLHPPNGLPVAGVTAFATQGMGSYGGRFRIRHMPGTNVLWAAGHTHYDIMGNTDNIWPIHGTFLSFANWFRSNLIGASNTPILMGENPGVMSGGGSTIRVLVSGALRQSGADTSRVEFVPETISGFNITGLDAPYLPAAQNGIWYHEHRLVAYDSEGDGIYTNRFYISADDYSWVGSFDLPVETQSYVIEKSMSSSYVRLLRVQAAGLQSVEWLSPSSGTAVGLDFSASWQAQVSTGSPDGRVSHSVFYQDAVDGPWHLAMAPTYETVMIGSSSFLPQTDYLRLKVVSSDGIASVSAVLDNLSVPPRPPLVRILHPYDGDHLELEAEVDLNAFVEDYDEVGHDAGQWTSSVQGFLGEGRNITVALTNGTHQISYVVLGNNGLSGSDSLTVTVHEEMTSLDLRLNESDLTLHNSRIDPTGMIPNLILPNELNSFMVRVRNQGVDAEVRVNMQVRHPGGLVQTLSPVSLELAPFEVFPVPFEFTASGLGNYVATAWLDEISPNDPNLSNNLIEATFSSFLPAIDLDYKVLQLSYPWGTGDPDVFYTTPERDLTVYNHGSAGLTISSIELNGAQASVFQIRQDNVTGVTIPPQGSATIRLRGHLRSGTVAHAILRIHSNDVNHPAIDALLFAVAGQWNDVADDDSDGLMNAVEIYVGTDPENPYSLDEDCGDMDALYDELTSGSRVIRLGGELDFGIVQVGQSAERNLLIHNFGSSGFEITGVSYPAGFSGPVFSGELAAGASTNITVTFSPVEELEYSGIISVTADHDGGTNTRLCTGTGFIPLVETPVFSPDGGSFYGDSVTVTVSCPTEGATIRYTVDGTTPDEASPVVDPETGTVQVPVPGTLRARAWKSGLNISEEKSAEYTWSGPFMDINPWQRVHVGGASLTNFVISVEANMPWTADVGECDWIEIVSGASGTGDGEIQYTLSEEPSGQFRVGFITVSADDEERMFQIVQLAEGKVIAWGSNWDGECDVPPGIDNVVGLAAGMGFSLVLHTDGTVSGWGGTWEEPIEIPESLANVVAIAAGSYSAIAVLDDGTVDLFWSGGHYGDGDEDEDGVPPGLNNVKSIVAGWGHYVALHHDGTVTAWGDNWAGQTDVPSGLSDVMSIASSDSHVVALRGDGTVIAWGSNRDGECDVPEDLSNVVAVAAGDGFSLALRSDGSIVAWGGTWDGPHELPEDLRPAVAISANGGRGLALHTDGTLTIWGSDWNGEGTVPAGLKDVVLLTAGSSHNLALIGDPHAVFRTASGIPYSWLLEHGLAFDGTSDQTDLHGKGMTVFDEWVAGTDPSDPASRFVISDAMISPSGFSLQWPGVLGRRYTVYWRTNLLAGAWEPVGQFTASQDEIFEFIDSTPNPGGFYLLHVELSGE